MPPDLTFFIHESGYRVIEGEFVCRLAPLINGKRTAHQIALKLKTNQTEIDCALLILEAEGYLAGVERGSGGKLDGFLDSIDADPRIFNRTVKEKSIRLIAPNSTFPLKQFRVILEQNGLRVSTHGDITIVLVNDYLWPDLDTLNRTALKQRAPWMIVKTTGTVLWFGPVFSPPHGPCWNCLALRLREKRRVDAFLNANGATQIQAPIRLHRQATNPVLNLAALEIVKHIAAKHADAETSMLTTLDASRMQLEKHAVLRRPDCPACGTGKAIFPKRIVIGSPEDPPGSPLDRYKHHISFRTGIIDEMKTIPAGGHELIHAVAADHLFVPNLNRKTLLQKGLTQKSWGKGVSREQAQTSALCEALERYSGIFRNTDFRITATERELGKDAIAINSCLNFSDKQYSTRKTRNRSLTNHDWIPSRLNPQQIIEWTPIWSLTSEKFRYLPTSYCYYGYPAAYGERFCRADSNGNAAGNTLMHAILNGFLELVERDCAAMWWFNRTVRPGVDIASFPASYLQNVQQFYRRSGRELWALDLTSDFNIPCFIALSANKASTAPEFLFGLGCHFDPLIALTRAITEMNQFLAVRLDHKDTKTRRTVPDAPYLRPDPTIPLLKFESHDAQIPGDTRASVKRCVQLAKENSMETFVLDQTREDVELPVVKVIVPGMRQFWRRFAPGRLYDVPVKLGWLQKPLTENRLNPYRFLV